MPLDRNSPATCFMTPPPSWKSRPSQSLMMPLSERKREASANKGGDLFHIIHKVPAGDSPYVKAKHVQLVDKDPGRAIPIFWGAINAGDRVESALKDMALVMKQLNRSDEAVEAIKSFRHLCPSDSQESLDNILVELYKRSGRVEEEIAMLHHKLKQIEDGVTFVGRTTKQARSQGKKIQITAEQEISRILGNLAWAYLQKGDYKTAEEHYRKALSFEADRNKQCNLAICLMLTNRITEAKFLLQAVSTASKNRKMDESFVKSFERASQMLIEIESSSSSSLLDPNKEKEDKFKETQRSPMSHISRNSRESSNSSNNRNWDKESSEPFGQNFLENNKKTNTFAVRSSMLQCTPQIWHADELKKGSCIENSCGKNSDLVKSRADNWCVTSDVEVSYARRRLYESPDPARRDLKVPFTKAKRCSWGFNNGYQRETWGDVHSDHKPQIGSVPNDNWRSKTSESQQMVLDGAKDFATSIDETHQNQDSEISASNSDVDKSSENLVNYHEFASGNKKALEKKSWADIVEEEENEEQYLFSGRYTNFDDGQEDSAEVFHNENEDSNIIYQSQKRPESFDQKDRYNNASGNGILSRNPTVRRSLSFNPELIPESTCFISTSTSPKKASNFEGRKILAKGRDSSLPGEKKPTRRNRLQVFQDITLQSSSP